MNNNLICRIEGHGQLQLNFEQNKAHLQIHEGERLFEELVVGRDYHEAPFISARICGVCPVAHSLASIKALERALQVKVSPLVICLRELMLSAQIIQSHMLHLIFLALPDYTEIKNAAQLVNRYPSLYHLVLTIKKVTDRLLETIGGRVVHPITPTVGGFLQMPDKQGLLGLLLDFEQVLDEAQDLVHQFTNLEYPQLNFVPTQLCLSSKADYSIWQGRIISNKSINFEPQEYTKYLKEEINFGSTAKQAKLAGEGLMVGALARVNLQAKFLNPKAKKSLEESGRILPFTNPFLNNLAQSLEVLHFLESIIKNLYLLSKEESLWRQEILSPVFKTSGQGAAAIEAPRGTLYYGFQIKDSQVVACDIITPTVQNLTSIEQAANQLLAINKDKAPQRKQKLVEMLIRSFDPCITCSVH